MTVVGREFDDQAGEVFGGALPVVHVRAHLLAEPLHVLGAGPLEARHVGGDALGTHRGPRGAGLGEQVAHHQRRVAHHVVQDAAALEVTAPEPRHVGTAVLLGGAGEIRPAGQRGAAGPDDGASPFDLRGEHLVLQIAVLQARLLYQRDDALGLGDVAGQRLLARNAGQGPLPTRHRVGDFLDVLDAREVRAAEPQRLDRGVGHHGGDGVVRLRLADVELASERGGLLRVLGVRAPHAEHVGVADASKALQVKTGVEPAADEADT